MVDRQRKVKTKSKSSQDAPVNLHQIDSQLGMLGVLLMLICGAISSYLLSNLPNALTRADLENNPGAFIAERAWENLKVLNDFGPKPIGSEANEKLAANYIKREIELIEASKHPNQQLLIEHQLVTGGHSVGFMGHPLTSLYRNLQNLVVKLVSEHDDGTSPALLLNCHFDTVASSPGASDDGASCCVMLEIMRVLSREPKRNRHSIIFLFNGAEETSLQAAHGFITQHPWAKQVAAFLNLESAGSGGKEILFQSGPQHPWLIDLYARAIRHPFAHAAAEEVFQSGLIPSDTDFRMFRDFGQVPGMDFAHVADGYRYHTKFDNIDYLSVAVLQRTGDNILSLTREMINSDELANSGKKETATGNSVFFDYLGLFFVSYSAGTGQVVNMLVSILAVLFPLYGLKRAIPNGGTAVYKETIYGFLATVGGTLASIVTILIIGHELDALGYALSWYSSRYLMLGLYCDPALLCHCFSQMIVNKLFADKKTPLNLSQIVQSRLIGVSLFWSLLIIPLTLAGVRSTYIIMVVALLSLLSSLTTSVLGYHNTTTKWLLLHLAFQIFTMLWASNYYHTFMQTFIPISGRIGGTKNPEFFIGLIAAFCTLLISSYITPLISLLKKPSELMARIIAIILITLFLTCFTPASFPYRDDSAKTPTVQRHYITHTLRLYHDERGLVRNSDSGFLFREMDRNSERVIRDIVIQEPLVRMREMSSCQTEIFCAIPFYSMWHQIRFDHFWLPGPEPVVEKMVTLSLLERMQISKHVQRLLFTMEGGVQTSLIIGPKPGVKLVNWNLLEELTPATEFNGQKGHFVLINYGLPGAPWNMTLDFEHQHHDGALADIAVVTTFWEYHDQHTQEFKDLIGKFPPWAHVIPSVAAMNVYVF
ncbi:endoplasmic reticulum metallopeptidase 1-like [Ochlerotatus camptorhynchus]|uniref:endoplasmic reticulum metallopeptidase 1-like n=1 Tax=Ochlerotatus camptorhynchus TaxID=644619 RepID=UPI0031DA5401